MFKEEERLLSMEITEGKVVLTCFTDSSMQVLPTPSLKGALAPELDCFSFCSVQGSFACGKCVGFGIMQIWAQNLHLPLPCFVSLGQAV